VKEEKKEGSSSEMLAYMPFRRVLKVMTERSAMVASRRAKAALVHIEVTFG